MSQDTGQNNPWFEAWSNAHKQFLQAQEAFVKQTAPMLSPNSGPSDLVSQAIESWSQCERQITNWMQSSKHRFGPEMDGDGENGIAAETMRRMMDPSRFMDPGTDGISEMIRQFTDGSSASDLSTLERQGFQATREWFEVRDADAQYRSATAAAWLRAFSKFSQQMTADPNAMKLHSREVLNRWLAIANDELIETQRSDEYLKAQARLLRAGAAYRLKERAMVEQWCEARSIPTRTEIDELHRTVYHLRREVRSLIRERDAFRRQVSKPATKRKTTQRSTRKKGAKK